MTREINFIDFIVTPWPTDFGELDDSIAELASATKMI
jgi:hypothetical protein